MKARMATLTLCSSLAAFAIVAPARVGGQLDQNQASTQSTAGQRADMTQMMAAMRANDQKLDDLVKRMNTAQGSAKVDAMAEILTTLVQDRHMMHESMSGMSMMMNMMGGMHGGTGTVNPQK